MANQSLAYCHARLPNAGLGNKLFVWARAHVFSTLNHLPLRVTGWTQFQLAPILHGFDFRLYLNYFKTVDTVDRGIRQDAERRWKVISEPPVERISAETNTIYEYSAVPSWKDWFGSIRPYRGEVQKALMAMLTPARMRELERQAPPRISVHVRLGDFRKLQAHESFDKVGQVRTPFQYFRNLIDDIRRLHGSRLPVEIMSDGSKQELAELLEMPDVMMGPKRSSIVDILTMSRSKIVICSASSSFSYWSGFLGDCALILHPDHIHTPIRPEETNRRYYEGPLTGPPENWPRLFLDNLRSI